MFNDTSERTLRINKVKRRVSTLLILLVISTIAYFAGTIKFSQVVKKSSTIIGTSMTFERSQAKVELADIYTDKSSNVLIARLSSKDGTLLPYKGSDYKVYIASKPLDSYKEVDIIFGRMSTDGDLFLVIPKPTSSVYSVFIKNTKPLYNATTSLTDSSDSDSSVTKLDDSSDTQSISKALSDYSYTGDSKKDSTYTISSDSTDMISFRLTIDPAIDSDEYKPKVIDANLLKGTEFQFETFFDKVFKESAINDLESDLKSVQSNISQMNKSKKELTERLVDNPNDSTAKDKLTAIESSLQEKSTDQDNISKQILQYKQLEYDAAMFSNLQTKATIISTKSIKK